LRAVPAEERQDTGTRTTREALQSAPHANPSLTPSRSRTHPPPHPALRLCSRRLGAPKRVHRPGVLPGGRRRTQLAEEPRCWMVSSLSSFVPVSPRRISSTAAFRASSRLALRETQDDDDGYLGGVNMAARREVRQQGWEASGRMARRGYPCGTLGRGAGGRGQDRLYDAGSGTSMAIGRRKESARDRDEAGQEGEAPTRPAPRGGIPGLEGAVAALEEQGGAREPVPVQFGGAAGFVSVGEEPPGERATTTKAKTPPCQGCFAPRPCSIRRHILLTFELGRCNIQSNTKPYPMDHRKKGSPLGRHG